MKKILCSLSIVAVALFAMIFAPLTVNASAEVSDDAEIASTAFYTRQGETFTTTIYIADNANIVDFDIHLTYNTENLTLIDATENEDIKGTVIFNTDNVGTIDINYTRTSANVTKQTFLVDLTFKVDENLAPGTYDCISVDKSNTYIAHTLVGNVLQVVDFECDFEPLTIYEMGDVDLSGSVDIGDATYIRRHLAKLSTLSEYQLLFADTYYDGIIDIADAVSLQRYLAKYSDGIGNRVNVTFYGVDGSEIVKKSVVMGGTLNSIPAVPAIDGYSNGRWSLSQTADITPSYTNITEAISVYARYDKSVSESMQWYIDELDEFVNGYEQTITTSWDEELPTSKVYAYDTTKTATIDWAVSNANIFSTAGVFTEPTYDTPITLTAKIYSYVGGVLESSTVRSYTLLAKGAYSTPTKAEIVAYLQTITNGTLSADGTTSVTGGTIDCDLNLVKKITNEQVGSATPYEVRIEWGIEDNGTYKAISQIKRSTSIQTANLVATISFNGKALEGDGKVYFDNVTLSAITEDEIRSYIINQVANNVAVSFSTGDKLWDNDTQYGCTLKWVSNETSLMTIEQNTVTVNADAVNGVSCPIKLQVSYSTNEGTKTFELEYSVTINTANELLQAGTNIEPALYYVLLNEMRDRFGITTLTTTALKNDKFVYLDLSQYKNGVVDPDTGNLLQITDLTGLAYCKNLFVLNISGLNVEKGLSEISTLNKLEALIANNCNITTLSSGGTPVLQGMNNLKLLDLSSNKLTSLDSVLDADTIYGRLKEVYLDNNDLNNITQLENAPFAQLLTLSNNNLDSADISVLSSMNYLTYLSLGNNNITDISSLSGLKNLTELRLQNNQISDVTALKDMTEMVSLYLGDNQITNVSKLDKLTKVTTLYLNNNAGLENIDIVSGMTGLKILNVSGNNIDNLNAVSSLIELTELYAEDNSISSFAFVQNLTNLNKLLLANNRGTGDESDNMSEYLSGLSNLTVLTLSGKKLNSLDFLQTTDSNNNTTVKPIVRLEVADCSLPSYYVTNITDSTVTEYVDNVNLIASLKQTLLYLDISGNGLTYNTEGLTFSGNAPATVDKLKDLSNLQLLYADNTDIGSKITTLTSMMSRIKYLSLENCNISDVSWLAKSGYYEYIDVANNPISTFNFSYVSKSLDSLQYLYLDTTATNAVYICEDSSDYDENILIALSLRNIGIDDMSQLPMLSEIQYLDVAQGYVDIFTKSNLDLLYENYKDIEVYLYADGQLPSGFEDDGTLNAQKEGALLLSKIDNVPAQIQVAATESDKSVGVISDNNPVLIRDIDGYITNWSNNKTTNYSVEGEKIEIITLNGIVDDTLTIVSSIEVYGETVIRTFNIDTSILRVSNNYIQSSTNGSAANLMREAEFNFDYKVVPSVTEGFSKAVQPVNYEITYTYSGEELLNILDENNHRYQVKATAPLNNQFVIYVVISHSDISDKDDMTWSITTKVVPETYTITLVPNGGVIDGDASKTQIIALEEDNISFSWKKTGYTFDGWYNDAELTEKNTTYSTGTSYSGKMPRGGITLYAKWIQNTYKVRYELFSQDSESYIISEGVTNNSANASEIIYDNSFTLLEPSRSEYDRFIGWYADESFATPINDNWWTNWYSNPTDITFYAKWDLAIYYNTLEGTPKLGAIGNRSRVVVDWSRYFADSVDYCEVIDPDGDGLRAEGGNLNLDIANSVSEIYFIGNVETIFTNLTIVPCRFTTGQELVIHLTNFNFTGSIWAWESSGFSLTVDCNGTNQLQSTVTEGAIRDFNNVTISGNGTFAVYGKNGDSVSTAGANGNNGGIGISVDNLIVDTKGSLFVYGGNGSNGANATGDAKTGGNGGNGGNAIVVSNNVNVISGIFTVTSGAGGDGGAGSARTSQPSQREDGAGNSRPPTGHTGYTGGTGGNGGNSGRCIVTLTIQVDNSAIVTLKESEAGAGGKGGKGGKGGTGGNSTWWAGNIQGGNGGTGGTGGTGGDAGTVYSALLINGNIVTNYNNIGIEIIDVTIIDKAGAGGAGGDGGSGGKNTHYDWYGSTGSSGSTGSAGNAMTHE